MIVHPGRQLKPAGSRRFRNTRWREWVGVGLAEAFRERFTPRRFPGRWEQGTPGRPKTGAEAVPSGWGGESRAIVIVRPAAARQLRVSALNASEVPVRVTRSRAVTGGIAASEIFRPEPCIFGDFRQRCRPDLLAVVEAEREVPPAWPLQLSVRAHLLLQRPADSEQRSVDPSGLRCAPGAHAANKTFSGCGISSPLSIISART